MRKNHEIISIIRQSLDEKQMSISELARQVDMSKSTISRYMNETREFPVNKVNLFARVLGLESDYILGFNDKLSIRYSKLEKSRQQKVFNFAVQQLNEQNRVDSIVDTQTVYLNSKLSADTGILDLNPTDTKEIEYSGFVPMHDFAFQVSGDSMSPAFENNEIVFVERTSDVNNGQFIAVQINEESYVKKVYIEDDSLRLVSLNKDYKDIVTSSGDDIQVIGRVIF